MSTVRSIHRFIRVFPLIAALAPVARAAQLPAGPTVFLNTTPPTQTGQTISVPSGGNLQAALNAAQPGDTIELAAGATFTGNFILPKKTGSGWVWIRTSAYGSLPPRGTRVSPSNANLMAKISSPNTSATITFDTSASFYRLSGLEITTTYASTSGENYGIIALGTSASGVTATSLAQLPTDIVIDRCYVHGTPSGNVRRGIALNSARTAVVDSYFSDFHELATDSQAIAGWNGPGPFAIVNNYLEAAAENVMFGGSDPAISNLVPSDIEIRNNLFTKKLSWKAGDPSYAGIGWAVKNLLELKNARRVLVNGNTFERIWAAGQSGHAIVLTPRNQNGSAPWSAVQDITFTNNVVRQAAAGINILGTDDTYPSQRTSRVLIRNNLFYDIDGAAWSGGSGVLLQVVGGVNDLSFRHNTAVQSGGVILADGSPANSAFEAADNIAPHNAYGVYGSGRGVGNAALDTYFPQAVFTNNALAGPWPTSGGATTSMYSNYPGNFFPSSLAAVGFVDLANDNYRLTSSSPFKGKASDGTDVGVDFTALDAALAGATAPLPSTPPPTNPTPVPTATPSSGSTDKTAPTTSIVTPSSGATLSGTQPISVTASDNVGVTDGAIMIDGAIVASFSGTSATYNWNTSQATVGGHTLQSKAQDAAGNVGMSAPVSVTVAGASTGVDTTPPNLTFAYPVTGTPIASGPQTIRVNASDNVGVTLVKIFHNGSLRCQVTTSPYTCGVSVSGTLATFNATAFDAAGNSRSVEVTVAVGAGGSTSPSPAPTPSATDTTPPNLTFAYPVTGTPIASGPQTIRVNASDNVGVTLVKIFHNGSLRCQVTTSPYTCGVSVSGTLATFNATAFDAAGNSRSVEVTVAVGAGGSTSPSPTPTPSATDTTPPNVTITYPLSGATIASGPQTVTANASDNVGVTLVKTYLNGSLVCQDTTAPYACPISVSGSGATIVVTAFDARGNSRTAEVNVRVAAASTSTTDTTPPNVTITYPLSGATLASGAQTITANASDNVGVAVVKTYLNGSIVCQDTTTPYACPVSLRTGAATIDVTAVDARGNSRTHEVNVWVR
jgi:hypothetical protein